MFKDRVKLQFDGNKLLHHLDRVNDWSEGKEIVPIYVAFSPTSLCNHACTFCVYHYKKFEPIYFPKEKFFSMAKEMGALGVKSMFFAGDGEPLLNKATVDMVEFAKTQCGIDVAMNTNGVLLTKEKAPSLAKNLEWIRFSINAGTPESYEAVHKTSGKDFEKVIANLENLANERDKLNSDLVIGTQLVLLPENKNDIPELAKRLKSAGVNYFAVKPFLKHPGTEFDSSLQDLDETLSELSLLRELSDSKFNFVLREALFKESYQREYCHCLAMPFMIEVDANGDVYNCGPHIGNKDHCLGNLLDQSFEQLWNSDLKKKVQKYIENDLDVSKCMPFCRPHSVNRFLWELKNPPMHVNYI